MAKKNKALDADEAQRLFSELDDSGVIDPMLAVEGATARDERRRARRRHVDPLSDQDPSGSKVGQTITRTSVAVILVILAIVVGMQVVYGVSRRLSTANLSENVDVKTVDHAMQTGVEWGDGFTQFPATYTVDEANEKTGVVRVSVVNTDAKNELELLSSSQIQAAALATNALLNEKVNRVVYNVSTLVREDGSFARDRFFGFVPAQGAQKSILSFIWTKEHSGDASSIDWKLQIIGMDDEIAGKIQDQVNSVSSLIDTPAVTQRELDREREQRYHEHLLHGSEIFTGGPREKDIEDVLPKK